MAQTICYTQSVKNDTDGIAQTIGYTRSIKTQATPKLWVHSVKTQATPSQIMGYTQ